MVSDSVNRVPAEYPGVVPYLVVREASKAIDFYKSVFGAEELIRLAAPDGTIGHAELRIAGGPVMLADEVPEMEIMAPPSIGGSATGLMLYVDDADSVFNAAVEAGAVVFKPICDQFYGDRCGTIDDPFGHRWTISSRIECLTHAEVQKRFQDLYGDE
ncbi:MAG: VOC family protein [Planctomycetaceae bacterium]